MPTIKEQIKTKAIEILKNNKQGVRYSHLVNMIKESFPNFAINTIHGTVWNLDAVIPTEVYKADRGLFRHTSYKENQLPEVLVSNQNVTLEVNEEDFYQPFADYLKNELEECTKAIKLGGSKFRDKWGTPDVIGIKKSRPSDIIQQQVEIVSAEIKIDTSGLALITAFGQSCSYRTFSHKVYIVIPKDSNEEDKSRIESLCLIFGIGLILFNSTNTDNPDFEIRVRPNKHEPDMFYVNKYMKIIESELFN
ncbi:hypothetical protein HYU10_05535 [Candidatus Woesearchaeota archaeon]|nr:hypothetical protein [Candidatus Woesearchaeota archaeon]MBI2661539.1 hypothetical protein [Candidatus Woesearchaeota archaeon]